MLSLLGGLLALSPFTPAKATSGWCTDASPQVSVQLLDGDFGLPLWLGFESGVLDGRPGNVGLCYGTGAPGDAKAAGGYAAVLVTPGSNGANVAVANNSDPNAANRTSLNAWATPTYSLSPGGTGGGQALTVTIPIVVCSGPCLPVNQPADGTTGLIVGSISRTPTSSGGTSASYAVNGLCIKVDGATVLGNCTSGLGDAGATTTGTSPTNTSPATPGPCVVGFCAPSYNYIGTTGNQIATVYIPVLGPVPVYGVHTCVYQKDAATPCPY